MTLDKFKPFKEVCNPVSRDADLTTFICAYGVVFESIDWLLTSYLKQYVDLGPVELVTHTHNEIGVVLTKPLSETQYSTKIKQLKDLPVIKNVETEIEEERITVITFNNKRPDCLRHWILNQTINQMEANYFINETEIQEYKKLAGVNQLPTNYLIDPAELEEYETKVNRKLNAQQLDTLLNNIITRAESPEPTPKRSAFDFD